MGVKPGVLLNSRMVFRRRWVALRQDTVKLPDGLEVDDYFVSVRPDVVTVFPLTVSDDVVLVKQYKHAIQQITVELPAGTLSDESPEEAARRELLEETGYQCGAMKSLGQAHENASRNTNTIHMFLATGCVPTPARNLQDLEASAGIDVMTIPRSELLLQIRAGKIKELSSVATILRALDALAP